jgi:hypothetical protein
MYHTLSPLAKEYITAKFEFSRLSASSVEKHTTLFARYKCSIILYSSHVMSHVVGSLAVQTVAVC